MNNDVRVTTSPRKLTVCFDAGSSLSKILYELDGRKIKYMVVDPEHLALPASSAKHLPQSSGMGKPEDNAWVRLKKNGQCHVLGRVAKDYRAFVNLKSLKWETATAKILGALGAIAERENLQAEFYLDLGVLLPYGEINSSAQLEKELKASLPNFYFRSQLLQVKLERYQCVPEASGSAMWESLENPQFQRSNRAYLMFGHRNTSVLFFRRGSFGRAESSTTNLGFYDLIDKMREKVSGLERDDVLKAIEGTSKDAYYGYGGNYHRRHDRVKIWLDLKALAKSRSPEKLEREIEELKKVYETSLEEYWALLSSWLDSALPLRKEIDGVVRCGGASDWFESKLKNYFSGIEVSVPDGYSRELLEVLELDPDEAKDLEAREFIKQALPARFSDVWGFFAVFSGYREEEED
jgi:hypothetical protein